MTDVKPVVKVLINLNLKLR